jgi:lysophospholipase L1-like esterase
MKMGRSARLFIPSLLAAFFLFACGGGGDSSNSSPPFAPTATTTDAASITGTSAELNGSVNPNGLATNCWFEWDTDSNLASYTLTPVQSTGSGNSSLAVSAPLSSLSAGTEYYFRVAAVNSAGTSKGAILSFTTLFAPTLATKTPTSITKTSAVLNGEANPKEFLTNGWFEYGTDPSLASFNSTGNQNLGAGSTPVSFSASVSLSQYVTYYYRAVASNPNGTQRGPIKSFLTGETYVAVGDSITYGEGDDIPGDGIGYEPILADLLGAMIANEGVSGATSANGAAWISATLSAYPSASSYLIQYGTNDAWTPMIPSGVGLNPGDAGYNGSYKDNMQKIISAILAAGKTPHLAKAPWTSDPTRSDTLIQEYNVVIDELKITNGLAGASPDYYNWFKSNPGELLDGIHPNGAGYQSMADLWFSALP